MFAQVFGQMLPDPASEALGTGYMRFANSGVSGLARIHGNRADILAISASNPGTGQVRQFLHNCQKIYSEVHVWEVWNKTLAAALLRYGFKPETEIQDGEELDGFVWSDSGTGEKANG